MATRIGQNRGIRYSEAFKMMIVREVQEQDLPFAQIQRKYDIRGAATVVKWVRRYGNGTRGKRIRVEKPEEINETAAFERAGASAGERTADANIDLALERAYTEMACERAGLDAIYGLWKAFSIWR